MTGNLILKRCLLLSFHPYHIQSSPHHIDLFQIKHGISVITTLPPWALMITVTLFIFIPQTNQVESQKDNHYQQKYSKVM